MATDRGFQRHAAAILRLWEQARREATLPAGHKALLRIGSEAGLWNSLLCRWIPWMRRNANDIALRCDVGLPNGLLQGLQDGTLDAAVLYSPRALPGLSIRLLLEEELYVHIDWGDGVLPEARPLSLPIYAAYPTDADDAIIGPALTGLKAILGDPAGGRDSL